MWTHASGGGWEVADLQRIKVHPRGNIVNKQLRIKRQIKCESIDCECNIKEQQHHIKQLSSYLAK
jgi:hypothetical protein